MSDVEVVLTDMNGPPATTLAVQGWLELNERGLSDGILNMANHLKAFVGYAANGRDVLPVGVLTWDLQNPGRVWVYQSFVVKEFRGRGVYAAMWGALVAHAIEKLPDVRSIAGATHVRNKELRAAAARLGRVEEAVILRFDLPR